MKDILFIIQSESMPSSRIRIIDLVPELERSGLSVSVEVIPKDFLKRRIFFRKAANFSVVVLQKKMLRWLDFFELRHYAKKLVFDFDDAIYLRCASPSKDLHMYQSRTRRTLFNRIINGVDLVICANEVLLKEVKQFAPQTRAVKIPSSIDIKCIVPKADYRLNSNPVIGWIGTRSTLRYLNEIKDVLINLQRKHNIILRVIADSPYEVDDLRCEFIPWSLDNQYRHICEFDIGIMPLSDDPFSRGKASFKLLQYLACGVPAVCSAVGMNIEVSENEKNCLLAYNQEDFFEKLNMLITNQQLRETLGKNGPGLIRNSFSKEVVGKKLSKVLHDLI